jgi:hypothetical protein
MRASRCGLYANALTNRLSTQRVVSRMFGGAQTLDTRSFTLDETLDDAVGDTTVHIDAAKDETKDAANQSL